jgi:hypothetical protein
MKFVNISDGKTKFVPDNDTLNWSILILSDEASAPGYLFSTRSGRIEFVIIETEFSQLNDYCVLCLTQTLDKLDGLRSQLAKYKASKETILDPIHGDITQDLVWSLAKWEIPAWEENYHFTARAMCLILLSFFTEKSLKSLCVAFAPESKFPKQKKGESKTSSYIKFLREECGFDFIEPQEFVDVREKCREIRNSFAHGDWDDIKAAVSDTNLPEAFYAVANLFYTIESKAYPDDVS